MKAKTSIKKTLSMIVVLVMLLTMIPAGMISVSAAATIDLSGYDSTTEYVIANAEDWALIAAATDKDFAGKTVKLGADIDAAGAALAPLFTKFAGTFDGQGFTVSNATVAGTAVIAKELMGGATVQNFKLVNVDLMTTEENAGMIAGTFTPASTAETTTISKISVDADSSVIGTTNVGGLLGFIPNVSNYTLSVSNISIEAVIAGTSSGGLFGKWDGGNRNHNSAYINVSTSLIAPSSPVQSGLIGTFGGGKHAATPPSKLTLTDVIVAPDDCTYALWKFTGGQSEHRTDATNLYVTTDTLYSTSGGYTSTFNGTAVHRPDTTIDAIAAKGVQNLPTAITAEVGKASAIYDGDGFITGLLPENVIKVNGTAGVLDAVVNDAAGINAANFAAALEALATNLAAAEKEAADPSTDPDVKAQLEAAVANGKAAREEAVAKVLTNLNTVIADLEAAKVALNAADQSNAEAIAAATATLNGEIEEVTEAIAAAAAAATTADAALKTELATAMATANAEMVEAIEAIAAELAAAKDEIAAANKAIDALKAEDKALSDANVAQDASVKEVKDAAKAANTLALTGTIIGGVSVVLVILLAVFEFLRRKKA